MLLRLIFSLTLIILTISCQQSAELSFVIVEQGSQNRYQEKSPGMIVLTKREDALGINGFVKPNAQASLEAIDYQNQFAILVFQGLKLSNGYSVQIEQITRSGDQVHVLAQFQEPKPNEMKGNVITSPYILVAVEKGGDWSQETTFQLEEKGVKLVSVRQYVP